MEIKNNTLQYTLEEINLAARWLIAQSEDKRVWLFDAPMGGGKTTLIKELCSILNVDEVTSSPTFAIVNEYHTKKYEKIYHIDAYRLESMRDGANIGVDDYLDSGAYCFIEWPKVFGAFLPEEAFRIRIDVMDENTRQVSILDADTPFIYDA